MKTEAIPIGTEAVECRQNTDCIGSLRCSPACIFLCAGGFCKCVCPSTKFHV
ncbi:hypothetical protein Lalb_Chr08g0238081 [Lupinus albus]|uniref:Uncharacterized protein n=1 Tax=Lupinus albus TaxID=3870 RepID=A0A6A4Q5D8_LUPAL|nr:hypothetical protein Lalb_Chr08g0238081 [Lupinus albus]